MTPTGVMHLIDTLEAGGAERMAVNLANRLPQDRIRAFLCATRREGALASGIEPHVGRLRLGRQGRFDLAAIRRLARFVRDNEIQIVHAHSSSIFIAAVAVGSQRGIRIIWHDHYGKSVESRNAVPYRIAGICVSGVIAASELLAAWSRSILHIPAERVWYIPNFAESRPGSASPELPGRKGSRIVHVANLRPQKGHPTLLRAFAAVILCVPDAHLLLVGGAPDQAYRDALAAQTARLGLEGSVTMLGSREDVPAILAQCDIGVLSSSCEGMPVSLIEYGMAGLPSVATAVGQCPEVLDGGAAGVLVPPGDSAALANALCSLLLCPALRSGLGGRFRDRVNRIYNPAATVRRVCDVYEKVIQN